MPIAERTINITPADTADTIQRKVKSHAGAWDITVIADPPIEWELHANL